MVYLKKQQYCRYESAIALKIKYELAESFGILLCTIHGFLDLIFAFTLDLVLIIQYSVWQADKQYLQYMRSGHGILHLTP